MFADLYNVHSLTWLIPSYQCNIAELGVGAKCTQSALSSRAEPVAAPAAAEPKGDDVNLAPCEPLPEAALQRDGPGTGQRPGGWRLTETGKA